MYDCELREASVEDCVRLRVVVDVEERRTAEPVVPRLNVPPRVTPVPLEPAVAPQDGTVASINVAKGDSVEVGAVLATMN